LQALLQFNTYTDNLVLANISGPPCMLPETLSARGINSYRHRIWIPLDFRAPKGIDQLGQGKGTELCQLQLEKGVKCVYFLTRRRHESVMGVTHSKAFQKSFSVM